MNYTYSYFVAIEVLKQSQKYTIDIIKLQHLMYIAHGAFLAIYGRPLIHEHIRSYHLGVKICSICEDFKDHGVNNIVLENLDTISSGLTTIEKRIISMVVHKFGSYSTLWFLNLVNQSESLFCNFLSFIRIFVHNENIIKNKTIKKHFTNYLLNEFISKI